MKLTVDAILLANDSLLKIKDAKIPITTSYKVGKLSGLLKPIVQRFNETKDSLIINEFGEQDSEKPNMYKLKQDKVKEFTEELQKLLDIEEEVIFTPFKVSDFGNLEVEPSVIINLGVFVEE